MKYTIKQMAEISGVSARTLRFYDEQSLLKPAFLSEAGYRMYTRKEVDRLQQILLYRSMGLSLKKIKEVMDRPDTDVQTTLIQQRAALVRKRDELDHLLEVVENTLRYHKGEIEMTDQEKFEAFKKDRLQKNEAAYGEEIRANYGEETVDAANQRWLNKSASDYQKMETIETELLSQLTAFLDNNEVPSPLAEKIFSLHRSWLQLSWPTYTPEAHSGISELYLADERFQDYYDKKSGAGATAALCHIISYYTKS